MAQIVAGGNGSLPPTWMRLFGARPHPRAHRPGGDEALSATTPEEIRSALALELQGLNSEAARILASFRWLHEAAWSPDHRGATIPETKPEEKGLSAALGTGHDPSKVSNPTQDVAFDGTKRDQRRVLERQARRLAKVLERTRADLHEIDYRLRQALSDEKDPVPSFITAARPARDVDIREAVEAQARRQGRGEGHGSG